MVIETSLWSNWWQNIKDSKEPVINFESLWRKPLSTSSMR